jgi:hypothetical protein
MVIIVMEMEGGQRGTAILRNSNSGRDRRFQRAEPIADGIISHSIARFRETLRSFSKLFSSTKTSSERNEAEKQRCKVRESIARFLGTEEEATAKQSAAELCTPEGLKFLTRGELDG